MGTRLTDSPLYAHLWSTPELDAIFSERARLARWLEILIALARAQAASGIIPTDAAHAIADQANVDALDIEFIAEQTRLTSHSTLGLIRGLQRVLPAHAREYVYYGATVQDITDTWFATVVRDVAAVLWRDLRGLEALVLNLADEHRDTTMIGRTHGQPGAPITFGFKAASWADELRRHVHRLAEGRSRWLTGQLGGAVGVLGFFGEQAIPLRQRFCAELGLFDPGISWLSSRDRIAEFGHVLAMICATAARIGGEVFELQRPEIGELTEPANPSAVSSITMPHKRNPETSEHLDTLARLARASSGVLLESMVGVHERDGRTWKAEWVALPEVCLLTGTALRMANTIVGAMEVHAEAMAANMRRVGDGLGSERILAVLSTRLGKHRAQQSLQDALRSADDPVRAIAATGAATAEEIVDWLRDPGVAGAGQMVDIVTARARAERVEEPATWT
jgi:adenylosuccinate lyase